MKKVVGIATLLALIMIVTGIINTKFFSPYNIRNILRWVGLFGILSMGEALVIISGGIDLSLGSICGFIGSLLPLLIATHRMNVALALFICFAISLGMGITHGVFVTKLKMQPFIVTLCGLFIYRGVIRFITNDITQSFGQSFLGLKFMVRGVIPADFWSESARVPSFIENWSIPMPLVIMIFVAVVLWLFLNRSIYGRYLFALGCNERAVRFSGINTDRIIIVAYTISALLGGLAAVLFALYINGSQPSSQGVFFELYAIAGAVIGGCSLRGGEGNILGIVLGTAIVRVLYNAINILGIATQLEYAIVGVVILGGVAIDEFVKLYTERRQAEKGS